MLPGPCPYIDVSVDDVMLACLANTYIYIINYLSLCVCHSSSAVRTADYFPFRYFSLLFATYVSICNAVDYMGSILILC
jgi:hypothetical protein